jgi:ubiquinone/menaquinone biosynthesis C-methylase UbiE
MKDKKYEVRRRYDATATQYDKRYLDIQMTKYIEIFSEIDIDDSEIILDVGGGTGLLLDFMENQISNIFCCDISFNMLKEGKSKHKANHFICADSDYLPFKENIFNKVICISVIQNVPNPQKTLREIYSILRCEGILILTALAKLFSDSKIGEITLKANFSVLKLWQLSIEDISVIAKKNDC